MSFARGDTGRTREVEVNKMPKTAKRIAVAVLLAAAGALAGKVVGWGWDYYFKPFSLEVDAYYRTEKGEKKTAQGATIDLNIPGVERKTTDDRGKAYWHDLEPHPAVKTAITAELAGYQLIQGPAVAIRRRWGAIELTMEPDGRVPTPPADPAPAPLPEVSAVYRSGPRPSGAGKDFGPWWTQCSEDPPASGYVIKSEHFELVGDRQCGAWSECQQVSRTPAKACYQFRMQGHDEWGGPLHGLVPAGNFGQALSEGVLTVVWMSQKSNL